MRAQAGPRHMSNNLHPNHPAAKFHALGRRFGVVAASVAMTASMAAAPVSAIAEASQANVTTSVTATTAGLGLTKSDTVAKSGADALRATLGDAPSGKEWRWVTDSPATTKVVVDKEAYDEEVTVWKTSDGREFDTEDAAKAHAEKASVRLAGTKTYYKTSDGQEFATQAEAERHAAAETVTVTVTGSDTKTTWTTSDGQTFGSEDAARQHASESSKTVTVTGSETTWKTSDGKAFDTEEAAKSHAAEASEVVTCDGETRVSFLTSDGEEFASEGEAKAHVDASALTVSEGTRTVHHDAATHEEAVEETGHFELADAASGDGGKQDAGTGEGKPSDGRQAADGDKSDAGKDDGSASAKPDDRKAVAPSVKRAPRRPPTRPCWAPSPRPPSQASRPSASAPRLAAASSNRGPEEPRGPRFIAVGELASSRFFTSVRVCPCMKRLDVNRGNRSPARSIQPFVLSFAHMVLASFAVFSTNPKKRRLDPTKSGLLFSCHFCLRSPNRY